MIEDDSQKHPFSALLGIEVEHRAAGQARLRMPYRSALRNDHALGAPIHGGAIAALIDTAAAVALWTEPIKRCATIAMNVNYLRGGHQRDLIATAKVRRRGASIASLSVEVHDEAGDLIADALLTFRIA